MTAITMLRAELSGRGFAGSWIRVVDERTVMLVAGEQIVLCRDGFFWWGTGRFREGRTVTGVHAAADPAGAARRLARRRAGVRDGTDTCRENGMTSDTGTAAATGDNR